MKVKVWFYVLTDCKGTQRFDVVCDLADNICIGGYDKEGNYQQYDSYEGYHAHGWAEKHGFILECLEKDVEIQPETKVLHCLWCGDEYIENKGVSSVKFKGGFCSIECKEELEPDSL